jgi:hypothetical protein
MRVRATAATAALLLAALTACGGSDDGGKTDSASKPKDAASGSSEFDCMAENVSQADWMKHCNDEGAGTGGDGGAAGAGKTLQLGEPAQTTGDGGTGVLEITPDTIVFTKKAGGETAANGTFVVVTMKDKAMTAVAADEPAPISGGGWKWMAPDGEMVGWDSGNSTSVTVGKFENADPVQPGAWQWRAQVFDLTLVQAKGGTLIYVDGEETAFRWKVPSTDSGPNVAEVKKQLEF